MALSFNVGSTVPSLFSPDYLKASRNFIRNITKAVQHEKMLYFETTVEPQFMGNHALDWSKHCCAAPPCTPSCARSCASAIRPTSASPILLAAQVSRR